MSAPPDSTVEITIRRLVLAGPADRAAIADAVEAAVAVCGMEGMEHAAVGAAVASAVAGRLAAQPSLPPNGGGDRHGRG
jgi:hypothetical protein